VPFEVVTPAAFAVEDESEYDVIVSQFPATM